MNVPNKQNEQSLALRSKAGDGKGRREVKTSVLIGLARHRINVDSAGVTTLVAFHGCPLACKYCLNPQALSAQGVWKRFTPKELYDEVKRDDLYFRATGGGVTFGGGEPLLSYKEILRFFKLCAKDGKRWRINIETSLNVPEACVQALVSIVAHWIVDIKDMNPDIYKAYTGKDNKLVSSNLRLLVEAKAKVTARVPLIASFNTESDADKSAEALHDMGITDIDRFTYIIKNHQE